VYPFGHGLSYTTFEYGELDLASPEVAVDGELRVSFTVTNTGDRAGTEVAQLYVRDVVGSVSRPVLELKGFARVPLDVGERRRVEFVVPTDVLSFTGIDGARIVEPGAIEVKVGASSADIRLEATVHLTGTTRTVASDRALFSTARVA
jgi:beta-glucosidase